MTDIELEIERLRIHAAKMWENYRHHNTKATNYAERWNHAVAQMLRLTKAEPTEQEPR